MITQGEYKRVWKLRKDILGITVRIRELEMPYSGIRFESDGGAHGSSVPDLTARAAHKLIDLRRDRKILEEEYAICLNGILKEIDGISDPILASVLSARYVRGMTWTQTARALGGVNTPDGCRMIVTRYLSTLPE